MLLDWLCIPVCKFYSSDSAKKSSPVGDRTLQTVWTSSGFTVVSTNSNSSGENANFQKRFLPQSETKNFDKKRKRKKLSLRNSFSQNFLAAHSHVQSINEEEKANSKLFWVSGERRNLYEAK